MYKNNFGTNAQIQFHNEHEYYEFLGYLAKSDGTTSISFEHNENQGAWGSEGRILFYRDSYPFSAYVKHTNGTGNIISRVNCNEFIDNIFVHHGFVEGATQNISNIRSTVPDAYLVDFDRGLSL